LTKVEKISIVPQKKVNPPLSPYNTPEFSPSVQKMRIFASWPSEN